MKSLLKGIALALAIAFIFGSLWYVLFGYNNKVTVPENIIAVYTNSSFWLGLLIWTFLYFTFVTLPITLLKRTQKEQKPLSQK